MRLWHKDLIPVLPRQQLLGQWRECCAIMRNIETKGTPNHVLVNKIMDYPPMHIYVYASIIHDEMKNRGYRCNFEKFMDSYEMAGEFDELSTVGSESVFDGWMNERYLTQCYFNLQEKYDCGSITEDEWKKIYYRYKELISSYSTADYLRKEIKKTFELLRKDIKKTFELKDEPWKL